MVGTKQLGNRNWEMKIGNLKQDKKSEKLWIIELKSIEVDLDQSKLMTIDNDAQKIFELWWPKNICTMMAQKYLDNDAPKIFWMMPKNIWIMMP